MYEALRHKADQRVADTYFNHKLGPQMDELLEVANLSLDELLAVHKNHPLTVNSDYRKKLQLAEAKRLTRQLTPSIEEYAEQRGKSTEAEAMEEFIMRTVGTTSEENMDLAAAEYALDAMLAYYQVSVTKYIAICHVSLTNESRSR